MVKVYLVEDGLLYARVSRTVSTGKKRGMNLSVMPVMVNWHCR